MTLSQNPHKQNEPRYSSLSALICNKIQRKIDWHNIWKQLNGRSLIDSILHSSVYCPHKHRPTSQPARTSVFSSKRIITLEQPLPGVVWDPNEIKITETIGSYKIPWECCLNFLKQKWSSNRDLKYQIA